MSTVVKRWTYEDLVELPEDNLRHEIIDGEHVVSPAPFPKHQIVAGHIHGILYDYLRQHPIGHVLMAPCDVVFAADNVLEPDILYIKNERWSIVGPKYIEAAPDLAVEVISETRRRRDEVDKRAVYERFGVIEYWIADPERQTIKIHRRGERGAYQPAIELRADRADMLKSPFFPGLSIDLAELFR